MASQVPSSVLASLGFSADLERDYQRLLAMTGGEAAAVAASLGRTPEGLLDDIAPLVDRGIVSVRDGRIHVLGPAETAAALIAQQGAAASEAGVTLANLATAVPLLFAAQSRPAPGDVDELRAIAGEVTSGGDPLSLLTGLVSGSRGDLRWFRPDAWRMSRESAMTKLVGDAIASGRQSRAIYPAIVLQEAPDVLRARAAAGEQVRLVADLPTRLLVIGDTHAVLPEPLGAADEPRVLVRQPSLVLALTMLFELTWDLASPVPGLDHGEARPDLRRFLLEAMAEGAQDEQIARTLGISLRTVRRRVAALMAELGADSRFQAGVEAVRRGWL
jgi:DNA-binding CsgD family transcriptional regulator